MQTSQRTAVRDILIKTFPKRHVEAMLDHFLAGLTKFQNGDHEGVGVKSGKFVEAVTKCLMIYCGLPLPIARKFSAGRELKNLESLPTSYSDVIRIAIPKSCMFVYEIASNRGARHDSDDFVANEMDAKAVIPLMSWTLAEMIRFSNSNTTTPADISAMIEALAVKSYPLFEEIDGRPYINFDDLSAREIGLLLLYFKYPNRLPKRELIAAIARHGQSKKNAQVASDRISHLVDDDQGLWKLRGLGLKEAEELLKRIGGN